MANAIVYGFDGTLARQFGELLRQGGHVVLGARATYVDAEMVRRYRPDICLIRLNPPRVDGIELCRRIRTDPAMGVVALMLVSELTDEAIELSAFAAGADAFITHPFRNRVVLARIQALLRRPRHQKPQPMGFAVDEESYAARADGRLVTLTFCEFHVLDALSRNRGRVMSREDIMALVWGCEDAASHRLIDIYIQRLRKKLGHYATHIETVRGMGYRFCDHAHQTPRQPDELGQREDPTPDAGGACRESLPDSSCSGLTLGASP